MAKGSNSGADIRLIQAVHNTFRLGMTRMVDATAKLEPAALQSSIGPYWDFYSAILDYHHHNEDSEDFPTLATVYPDSQPLIDELGADHQQMVGVMEKISGAVDSFQKTPDMAGRDVINAAAIELRDLFFPASGPGGRRSASHVRQMDSARRVGPLGDESPAGHSQASDAVRRGRS